MAATQQNMTPAGQLRQKFMTARTNLLMMTILTAVNIVMLMLGSESMMLFSASIPYYAVAFPVAWGIQELFVVGLIVAIIIIALYFLCWLLSKKHPGWLIVAMVLFVLDTLALAGLYLSVGEVSGILDVLFHIWVLFYLFQGIISASKLKKMPTDSLAEMDAEPVEVETASVELVNSVPKRRADEDVKHRVLLECEHGTYRICYRRVKRINELVINGYVYDEYEALMELEHILSANLDGHRIEVGFDGRGWSFCRFDGEEVAKKMRLY